MRVLKQNNYGELQQTATRQRIIRKGDRLVAYSGSNLEELFDRLEEKLKNLPKRGLMKKD